MLTLIAREKDCVSKTYIRQLL